MRGRLGATLSPRTPSPLFVRRPYPEMFRERTPEEMEELRRAQERERAERYRGVYTTLASG